MLAHAQPVLARAQPVPACSACAQSPKSNCGKVSFSIIHFLQIDDIWLEVPNLETVGCLEFGDPKIQRKERCAFLCWIPLHPLWFGAQKCEISKSLRDCSGLLVLCMCLLLFFSVPVFSACVRSTKSSFGKVSCSFTNVFCQKYLLRHVRMNISSAKNAR